MTWDEVKGKSEKLIIKMAWKYGCEGHYAMNREDLKGEGWGVYAELVQAHPTIEPDNFWFLFQRSLGNHFNQLTHFHLYTDKRRKKEMVETEVVEIEDGKEVVKVIVEKKFTDTYIDLSDVSDLLGSDRGLSDALFDEYVNEVKSIIKSDPDLLELFTVLIDPPKKLEEIVWAEHLRKRQLNSQGVRGKWINICIPALRHFKKYLGWEKERFDSNLDKLKLIVLGVIEDFGNVEQGSHIYNSADNF